MRVIKATIPMIESRVLIIGFVGENERTQVRIDCTGILTEYPHASPSLAIKPPVGAVYPVVVSRDDNDVVWNVSNADLQNEGYGELQLTFVKDGVVAKTVIGKMRISRSLLVTGEQPDVIQTWYDAATEKLAEVDAQIVELEGMVDTATDAATRAEQSESNATTSAANAATSAATATAKATEATTAATIATAKAAEAALSATQARNSAMSAANSESGATAKAAEAAQSAQTAAQKAEQITEAAQIATGKAEEASASATAAQASASNAASSATAASASETAAKASETAAGASATQAAQSAQNASTAAQTAEQKAAEATQSATDAAASATNAATSAETAITKAGEAAQSAQAVAETAEQLADSLEQIDQNTQDIADLDERKANIDGYYPDMTVGNAEQLNSSKYVENSEPYTLRTSGGTSDIGNREYLDAVVGGTVAWNQIIKNGNFADGNGWSDLNAKSVAVADGVFSITPNGKYSSTLHYGIGKTTSDMTTLIDGHKYFYAIYAKSTKQDKFRLRISNSTVFSAVANPNTWVYMASIAMVNDYNSLFTLYAYDDTLYTDADTISCKNAVCFDLTQMFGTTIADYIYSLEQATAGAGVAWFRKLFQKDYYDYNAGELLSVEGLQSHDMVGFNLLDVAEFAREYPAQCAIDGNVLNLNSAGGAELYFRGLEVNIPFDQSGGGCVSYEAMCGTGTNFRFRFIYADGDIEESTITSATTAFVKRQNSLKAKRLVAIRMNWSVPGTFFIRNFCLNLSHNGSRNGEYEPYEKHSYPLDSTVVLRGVPKVDANGVYWDGDRYLPDGTVERRYGVVDLGTVNWLYRNSLFDGSLTNGKLTSIREGGILAVCSKYAVFPIHWSSLAEGQACVGVGYVNSSTCSIVVKDSAYTDAASFKAAMQGVLLIYELATPTTETAQPYHSTQWVSDWGTEEFVSTGIVPVGHETRYPANLRDKLQHLPDAASGNGSYLITQTDGQMVLTPFPAPPSSAGNYVLKATVVNGVATYTWEVAT